ncbi:MAG TPA: prevent-host-death protein [Acinetobacter junii]|uniref:Prevent-host-death family protein n=1 Tax=Candidatus Woesebacteria bacterium GW2011_GWB1_38_8 TaxID=1618570 RepID=A0A0G0KZ14_9BACT|nr:MAG: Prevent-host-death family protein [Microgenomates group bacterium GW2011_GWC1_37_8]KKQ84918.1 MAG: Prevent-host-death family protein [Candidatus Woesebacteria bacterium GW2011_GWB1_38_8]HAV56642.1 prevent-host-death protein [Acinetobacter junii]
MKVLTVGEFKAKFSDVIADILKGDEVAVSYGKKKEKIGVMVPYKIYEKKKVRKLGIWKGKATVKFAKDFKMTDEEFLNS